MVRPKAIRDGPRAKGPRASSNQYSLVSPWYNRHDLNCFKIDFFIFHPYLSDFLQKNKVTLSIEIKKNTEKICLFELSSILNFPIFENLTNDPPELTKLLKLN